ncbi:LutC/YkgG family protein [Pseudodesulfovibrio piezophilus]|nr:LUD domain-containing protein [Pseudodesulfovibrio piezophilus]
MMNKNEQTFLNRVSRALGRDTIPGNPDLFVSRPKGELDALLAAAEREKDEQLDLLAILKGNAGPLNLHVHEVATAQDAGNGIAERVRTTETEWGGKKRVTRHDTPLLESLGLDALLQQDAIPVDLASLNQNEDESIGKARLRQQAEGAYIGVTGADWCAVDCAAIAVLGGPGKARATSLVPSVHIAVLTLNQLVANLSELYAKLESRETLPVSFNFISGPSKTADIEAQLVHGAHGPREMHLFVITG